jgi:type IV pilus assembly protein PilX
MLTRSNRPPLRGSLRAGQRGVVLMMALIVLVAMTLAGIALMRSVGTTSIIAGNLAFQQAARNAGDVGTEAAVAWLEANNGPALDNNLLPQGYAATDQPPLGGGQSWDN